MKKPKKLHPVIGSCLAVLSLTITAYEVTLIIGGYETGSIRRAARGNHDQIVSRSIDGAWFDLDMGAHYLIATAFLVFAILKIDEVAKTIRAGLKNNFRPEMRQK